ncbi:MAG: LapA family protein [Alphaproteobacteria bacterium]|jgi:uncharacterized integral membrane protein
MRAIGLIILLVLLVAAVFFSMANREIVTLGIWPLDLRLGMPIFLPVLGAVAVGFVLGWLGAWRKAGQVRKQLRQALRENRDAAIEVDRLKGELKLAQSSNVASSSPQIAA